MRKKKKIFLPFFSFGRKSGSQRQISLHGRVIIFSVILFLFIFSVGSLAFITIMGRFLLNNTGQELVKTVELKRLRLEAAVDSEIAIALKMADSPLIKRHFLDPGNRELEKMAFEELNAYRRAFSANSVFWVNDIDKIFYSDDFDSYLVDPLHEDNYWYNMTMYKTEVYNFNINFNPDLDVTNLWINAPVFDNDNNTIGIVGTGINLSDFIKDLYNDYAGTAVFYFFNDALEITGAEDIALVSGKTGINDKLNLYWDDISAVIDDTADGAIKYINTREVRGVAVIGRIPLLGWYVCAIQHVSIADSLNTSMTFLFIAMMIVMMIVIISIFAVHESKLDKSRAEAAREAVISSIEYASKIQKNLLPGNNIFDEAFSDYSIIWKPRDIVGGDIYWIKNFEGGTVLCVCDCTGHGTPGALLTMLVVSIFESTVNSENYKDTSQIIWELEKRLVTVLNVKANNDDTQSLNIKDGCDLAVLFIAKDGSVTTSSGCTHVFVCDGKNVMRIKGQRIYVGEGRIKNKEEIKTVNIPVNPENKFYIASDGLFDQPGDQGPYPFGYDAFMEIILKNHKKDQSAVSGRVWEAFEDFRGNTPRVDDFVLVGFKSKIVN